MVQNKNDMKTHRMEAKGIYDKIEVDFSFEAHKDIDLEFLEEMWKGFIDYIVFMRNQEFERKQKEKQRIYRKCMLLSKIIEKQNGGKE